MEYIILSIFMAVAVVWGIVTFRQDQKEVERFIRGDK